MHQWVDEQGIRFADDGEVIGGEATTVVVLLQAEISALRPLADFFSQHPEGKGGEGIASLCLRCRWSDSRRRRIVDLAKSEPAGTATDTGKTCL